MTDKEILSMHRSLMDNSNEMMELFGRLLMEENTDPVWLKLAALITHNLSVTVTMIYDIYNKLNGKQEIGGETR